MKDTQNHNESLCPWLTHHALIDPIAMPPKQEKKKDVTNILFVLNYMI